jgi:hypothetical protein
MALCADDYPKEGDHVESETGWRAAHAHTHAGGRWGRTRYSRHLTIEIWGCKVRFRGTWEWRERCLFEEVEERSLMEWSVNKFQLFELDTYLYVCLFV